jgi:hypothetical protein
MKGTSMRDQATDRNALLLGVISLSLRVFTLYQVVTLYLATH